MRDVFNSNQGLKEMLIDKFVVLRKKYTEDEIGGRDFELKLHSINEGRLSTTRGQGNETIKGGKDLAEVDHVLFCLPSVDIRKNDHVEFSNKRLRVQAVDKPSNIEHHLQVYLEQLQPDFNVRLYSIINEKEKVVGTVIELTLVGSIEERERIISTLQTQFSLKAEIMEMTNITADLDVFIPAIFLEVIITELEKVSGNIGVEFTLDSNVNELDRVRAELVTIDFISALVQEQDSILGNMQLDISLNSLVTEKEDIISSLSAEFALNSLITEEENVIGELTDVTVDEFRKQITIGHTQVEDDLNDFPSLLVIEDDNDLSKAQEDGSDIYFMDDEDNFLDFEIQKFDRDNGDLIAWVKIPNLSSTEDTIYYIYYGDEDAQIPINSEDTWSNNYQMVHHFVEDNGFVRDSTSNNNDGDLLDVDIITQGAKIGTSAEFFGHDTSYINVGEESGVDVPATVEAWVSKKTHENNQSLLDSDDRITSVRVDQHESDNLGFTEYGVADYTFDYALTLDQYTHVVWAFDTTESHLYIDGVLQDTLAENIQQVVYDFIGDNREIPALESIIDELRISTMLRSADYVITTFNNQDDQQAWRTIGQEEEV